MNCIVEKENTGSKGTVLHYLLYIWSHKRQDCFYSNYSYLDTAAPKENLWIVSMFMIVHEGVRNSRDPAFNALDIMLMRYSKLWRVCSIIYLTKLQGSLAVRLRAKSLFRRVATSVTNTSEMYLKTTCRRRTLTFTARYRKRDPFFSIS